MEAFEVFEHAGFTVELWPDWEGPPAPSRRRSPSGSFSVSGPGMDRDALSVAHGAVLAQSAAERLEQAGTFYVRDGLGVTALVVERDALGVVRTRGVLSESWSR